MILILGIYLGIAIALAIYTRSNNVGLGSSIIWGLIWPITIILTLAAAFRSASAASKKAEQDKPKNSVHMPFSDTPSDSQQEPQNQKGEKKEDSPSDILKDLQSGKESMSNAEARLMELLNNATIKTSEGIPPITLNDVHTKATKAMREAYERNKWESESRSDDEYALNVGKTAGVALADCLMDIGMITKKESRAVIAEVEKYFGFLLIDRQNKSNMPNGIIAKNGEDLSNSFIHGYMMAYDISHEEAFGFNNERNLSYVYLSKIGNGTTAQFASKGLQYLIGLLSVMAETKKPVHYNAQEGRRACSNEADEMVIKTATNTIVKFFLGYHAVAVQKACELAE